MEERRRIEVVPYRSAWKADYERESRPLADVFGGALVCLHHVGSTSVPGLRAKPTIDILVEVAHGTEIPAFDPAMEELGYTCRGECLDAERPGTPGRFYFVRKRGVVHLTHVHVCAEGHEEIENMLALPDYLRVHPEVAREYGELKSRLAHEFAYDNIGYMDGKDRFVQETLERALEWRRGTAPDARSRE